nr:hypothetical protein [uncultured Dyadobacter sp.]
MKLLEILLLLFCFATSLSGCKEDDEYLITCTDGQVSYQLLNGSLNPGARLKEFDREDSMIVRVIQTEDELFGNLQISFLKTKIDFKRETLLVGVVRTHSLAQVVEQQVESKCASGEIILRTVVGIGGLSVADNVHIFAIVPKISPDTRVRLVAQKIKL